MRLLITGGSGRLARAAAESLQDSASVRLVDTSFSNPPPQGVEQWEGDLADGAFLARALEGVDVVVHLDPLSPSTLEDGRRIGEVARETYELMLAAINIGLRGLIVGSTLSLFDRLPGEWAVDESWRPRPEPVITQLAPWIAELCVRECARTAALNVCCLRFGLVVDDAEAKSREFDPGWVHLDDAVQGIRRGIERVLSADPSKHQPWAYHITAAGPRARIRHNPHAGLGYDPAHDFHEQWPRTESEQPAKRPRLRNWRAALRTGKEIPSRPIRNVVIFGAGGPVAAMAAQELKDHYTLRLTDVRPISEIAAEGKPQGRGAPLPAPLPAPHTCEVVDIRDPDAVDAACAGMDAVVNCTVVRDSREQAFRVNTEGAFNIMRGAERHGIRRFIQTGPGMALTPRPREYDWDYDLESSAPPRPHRGLYFITKYLGLEIARVFAEYYDLEVPVLLFCQFLNPRDHSHVNAFATSWQDSGRSIRAAIEAPSLPPYELINVVADLPHGRYSTTRCRELLGWEPEDRFMEQWTEER